MRQDLCVAAKRSGARRGDARRGGARRNAALLLMALSLVPLPGSARQPGGNECVEAGDFIKNAALARDGGISEADFIGRIRDDIELIQAFPPQLRWFVQDDEDAAFLLAAAIEVFRKPKDAREHQREFVKACLLRGGGRPLYRL
ncbi:MAG: hypothetical protein ACREX0_07245 [Noviherbaspirillum sp.]